nr:hypothetical protein PHYPA_001229 [Physcomitrium patens]
MTLEEFSVKEKKVQRLASDVLHNARDTDECGLTLCIDNCARHACSAVHTDNFVCANTLRNVSDCQSLDTGKPCLQLKLSFDMKGFVRLPPPIIDYSNDKLRPEITRAICSQSNLAFQSSSEVTHTFWNYFGSAEGVWRSFPGRVADPNGGCITYDPRKRPWYILATAVVKDLVILLDTGQQNVDAFKLAVNVVSELFDTVRIDDLVNVVTFDSTAATPLQPSSLRIGKDSNAAELSKRFELSSVKNTANGYSNISGGFKQARSMLQPLSKLKIFLVFTDGYFSKSSTFYDPALQREVATLKTNNVVVFFFSIGPGEADNPPDPLTELRKVSCSMNSTVTYVSQLDAHWNPLWAIRPYYDYQAQLRNSSTNGSFWTDPYMDFDGLGEVATVAHPVYANGTLYGVAGIDVFVDERDNSIIKSKAVDPNVPTAQLTCHLKNVNLSGCTKAVDPNLKPLCQQNMYLNEDQEKVYKNLLCCGTCTFRNTKNRNLVPVYLAAVGTSVVVIVLIIIIAVFALKYRAARRYVQEIQEDFAKASISTNLYTYKELKKATRNFHKDNKLGEGGFGEVFLGKIRDGSQVAVKRLSEDSKQGKPQFLAEVMIISKVQHRNLVKLRGCCVEGRHRLLVYEYLENKSLRETMLGAPEQVVHISWPTRFNIAVGTARGLAYLHEEITPRIIHRDIKASNILLDANLEAKISDFGLAKLCPDERTHLTTAIAGTLGYMAPEMTRGQLTEKVDVYSFGVLLMEIVTGRATMSITDFGSSICLIDEMRDLSRKAHETGAEELMLRYADQKLQNDFNKEEAIRVLKVALLCTNDAPTSRPSITQVVQVLIGAREFPEYLLKHLLESYQSTPRPRWYDSDLSNANSSYTHTGRHFNSPTAVTTTSASRDEIGCVSSVNMEGR